MSKVTDKGDPVYRCKECPYVKMRSIREGWFCDKTGETVPFNWIPESCPLEEVSDDES